MRGNSADFFVVRLKSPIAWQINDLGLTVTEEYS